MTNVAVYTRHSKESSGNSEETQTVTAQDFADRHDHAVAVWFHEGVCSSSKPAAQRPVASQMLLEAMSTNRRFDAILLVRGDRLFRDDIEERTVAAELKRYHMEFITLDGSMNRSTLEAELGSDILARIKKYERQLAGLRMRERCVARVLQGKFPAGYLPLGLSRDIKTGIVAPTDRAQDALCIFRTYIETGGNATQTARVIARAGIRSVRNNLITAHALLVILRSPAYRQTVAYGGRSTAVPELIPRIIPQDITDQVDQLLLRSPATPPRAKGSRQAYSGFLVCAACGNKHHMRKNNTTQYTREPYIGWECVGKSIGVCRQRRMSQKFIDQLVGKALKRLFREMDSTGELIPTGEDVQSARQHKENRQRQLQQQRARWAEMYAEGHIDRDAFNRKIQGIDEQLQGMQKEKKPTVLTADLRAAWRQRLDTDGWEALPQEVKRECLTAIGAEIVIDSPLHHPRAIMLYTAISEQVIVEKMENTNRHRTLTAK